MSIQFNPSPIPLTKDQSGIFKITGTRLSLDQVVNAFNNGLTCEEIVMQYPTLSLADAYLVISFYLNNQTDINDYLLHQNQEAATIKTKIQSKFPSNNLRQKILNRKQ